MNKLRKNYKPDDLANSLNSLLNYKKYQAALVGYLSVLTNDKIEEKYEEENFISR